MSEKKVPEPTGGLSRRAFVQQGSRAAAGLFAGALVAPGALQGALAAAKGERMRFGLVTYQWGRDWDLPTLIRNLEDTGVLGVELRVENAHRVDPSLSSRERKEVRIRFENTPVELVGFGTNWQFHYEDQAQVRKEIEGAKAHIHLSEDVGGSGVKVKPNGLPDGVPVEKTIEQIGRSLNEIGRYGADHGQQIRVEIHGARTSELPIMKRILEVADHPNVAACWNSNKVDMNPPGLAHNFGLVKNRLGKTTHVHQFDLGDYPYQELIDLLVGIDYDGWVLMEAQPGPVDLVKALAEQRVLFEKMVAKSRSRAT